MKARDGDKSAKQEWNRCYSVLHMTNKDLGLRKWAIVASRRDDDWLVYIYIYLMDKHTNGWILELIIFKAYVADAAVAS